MSEYQHTHKDCPLCKGIHKRALTVGFTTCALCGHKSPEPDEGDYRFIIVDENMKRVR